VQIRQSGPPHATEGKTEMDSQGYRRLHAAFTALAEQSNAPDMQLRWMALAQASSSLAEDPPVELRSWNEETQNARAALLLNRLANA
jgi:hypothetical protein